MSNQNRKKIKNSAIWIVGGILLLGAASLFLLREGEAVAAEAVVNENVTAVSPRTASTHVNATGQVQSKQRVTLSFSVPGRVVSVPVRVGDVVQVGDVLTEQETAVLEIDLANAQQQLAIQEATLIDLQNGATAAELASAEAAVASAGAYLAQLQDGPRPAEIAVQDAEMSIYTASTWSASAVLNQVNNSNSADQIAAARAALAQAQAVLEQARQLNKAWADEETHRAMTQAEKVAAVAQDQLNTLLNGPNEHDQGVAQADLAAAAAQQGGMAFQTNTFLQGNTPEQIAVAVAQLAQAEANMDALERGASDEQLTMAETAVSQAQLDVAAAQDALDKATLRAPFAGVITAVHAAEGTVASGSVIEMINPDNLEIVLKVSEIDIGQLLVGQTVIVHTEVWPTERLESSIVSIAPGAVPDEERVTYEIRLAFPESEHPVRIGMTVSADLITEK